MTDDAENTILAMLNDVRSDMRSLRDETRDRFGEIKQRILAIERGVSGVRRDIAETYSGPAAGGH